MQLTSHNRVTLGITQPESLADPSKVTRLPQLVQRPHSHPALNTPCETTSGDHAAMAYGADHSYSARCLAQMQHISRDRHLEA